MAHGNRTISTPNYGNPMESGTVKGDSDEVWEYSSPNTIPIEILSEQSDQSVQSNQSLQNTKVTNVSKMTGDKSDQSNQND